MDDKKKIFIIITLSISIYFVCNLRKKKKRNYHVLIYTQSDTVAYDRSNIPDKLLNLLYTKNFITYLFVYNNLSLYTYVYEKLKILVLIHILYYIYIYMYLYIGLLYFI